uniref:Uncharacterized protein n=1 Tax=Manihot esculenta TaxID=3983 RepID=A0A2C9V3C6_MANES
MNNMGMKMKAIGILMLIMACTRGSADLTDCAKQCMPSCLQQTAASQDSCAKACSEYCDTVKGRTSFGGWIDSAHPTGNVNAKGDATPNNESPQPQ